MQALIRTVGAFGLGLACWATLVSSAAGQIQAMPPSVLATQPPVPGSAPLWQDNGLREPPLAGAAMTAPGAALPMADAPGCSPYAAYDPPPIGLPLGGSNCWTWQLLPDNILYKSYLAGGREPRFGTQWVYVRNYGWLWDTTLGARVGVLRYGSTDEQWPEGWQIDAEGAAFPRLDTQHARDLVSSDFRFGVPLTAKRGHWEFKFAYYHLSPHLGDEYLLNHPGYPRTNYIRDSLVLGLGLRPHPDWRIYGEVGYAFMIDGGALPWEMQFGVEYSPASPSTIWGAPFVASNAHLRQENDFSGNVAVQAGWQWRGRTGHLFRIGGHYFNGLSDQCQFINQFEDQLGVGIWYDY